MKLSVLVVTVSMLSACQKMDALAGGRVDPNPTSRIPVIVTMGQSNMTGLDPDYKGPKVSGIEWLSRPGSGPVVPFAKEYRATYGEVAILNCAVSSTYIKDWVDYLYQDCIDEIEKLDTSLYAVRGLLFYQGEADTTSNIKRTPEWAAAALYLFGDFRLKYGQVPIVMAQIGRHTNPHPEQHPSWNHVRSEQASINLPKYRMIHTEDLPLHDALHYNQEGYRLLGIRFLEAYREAL